LIAKEITKIHEAFIREKIDRLEIIETAIKGELTIVISEKKTKIINFNEQKIVNKAKIYLYLIVRQKREINISYLLQIHFDK